MNKNIKLDKVKIARVRYNGRIFDVFSNPEGKKSFLEVIINDDESEKYSSPFLSDVNVLHKIYNIEHKELNNIEEKSVRRR